MALRPIKFDICHLRKRLMQTILIILPFLFLLAFPVQAQMDSYGLPPGAQMIEMQPLKSTQHPHRALLLWMAKPVKVPRDTPDDPYTCPEFTRGHYYQGPTRVSLVDTQSQKILNTIKILRTYAEGEDPDTFDIPYLIMNGFYYDVPGAPKEKEGKPAVMHLKDYNGDGKAWEFALFDALACMGLQTTLIGYSEAKDQVIQYPVELTTVKGKQSSARSTLWVDYLFSKKPEKPGFWKYAVDYTGRAGPLAKYEIRYLPAAEKFTGRLVLTGGDS